MSDILLQALPSALCLAYVIGLVLCIRFSYRELEYEQRENE
jgi:hypothetical protein